MIAQPCPLFVPLVENGRIRPGDVVIETVAAEYLSPLKRAGVDTLVLGCTHYPLLEPVIANYMGPEVRLVSAGAEGAGRRPSGWRRGTPWPEERLAAAIFLSATGWTTSHAWPPCSSSGM